MSVRIVPIMMALFGLSIPSVLPAQQLANSAPNLPDPTVAQPAQGQPIHATDVGDTTRYLLQLQADGGQAGKPLPMVGDEATASYRRYLKSFEHPIPEFYDTTVGKTDDSGR